MYLAYSVTCNVGMVSLVEGKPIAETGRAWITGGVSKKYYLFTTYWNICGIGESMPGVSKVRALA